MEKNIILAQVGRTKDYGAVKYQKLCRNNPCNSSTYDSTDHATTDSAECIESKYSFHVILNELDKDESKKADYLILVGTKESSWANVCEFFGEKYNKKFADLECKMQNDGEGVGGITNIFEVKEEAEKFLTDCLGTEVKILIQKNGIIPSELKENFNLLISLLTKILISEQNENQKLKVNLHLDISNGFRSFPIYVFLSSNYIAQILPKQETHIFMYYGMFDKKLELQDGMFVSSRSGSYVPYIDMSDASDIMQWTDAIVEFYNSGSVIQILKILNSHSDSRWADIQIDDKQNTIASVFQKFSYAINSNNLKLLEDTTRTLAQMDNWLDEKLPDYAKNLLMHIAKDFQQRFFIATQNCAKYGMLSMQTAIWYLDQQRIGDAVIALQEGMITYVMEKFPSKCETLINKKINRKLTVAEEIGQGELPGDKALFKFEYREIIREYVFDIGDITGKEWLRGYKYLCEHLRDPAMRMQYNAIGTLPIETDMEHASEYVRNLAQNILNAKLDSNIEKLLDELLNMQEHDFFISYRRTFCKKNDGIEIASGIAKFLQKQTYKDPKGQEHNYKVFWDQDGLLGIAGEFPPKIRQAIRNSRYMVLILGHGSFDRHYPKKDAYNTDYYYMEILTAMEKNYKKEIFVVLLDGFQEPTNFDHFPDTFKESIQRIIKTYQHINNDQRWGFSKEDQDKMYHALLKSIQKNHSQKLDKIHSVQKNHD